MRIDEPATFESLRSWLQRWTDAHADRIKQKRLQAELDLGGRHTEKLMVAMTLEGPARMGQFLLWETGEAELGVIEVLDGQDVLVETREVTSLFGLQESLNALVSAVLGEESAWPLPI